MELVKNESLSFNYLDIFSAICITMNVNVLRKQ